MNYILLTLPSLPFNTSSYLITGLTSFAIYFLFCFFKEGYQVSALNLIKSFPVGFGALFGVEIFILASNNECGLTRNQALALALGGISIIVFAFNGLKIFIEKSKVE